MQALGKPKFECERKINKKRKDREVNQNSVPVGYLAQAERDESM